MALLASTIFEIRTTGSDTNGGGFVTGASGTDYSQQNTAQYALTGLTSAGAGDTILSAAAAADMVGNIARAVSGTNITVGSYQVVSVVVGVSITFSTNGAGGSICTGVAASGVINIGGALLTIAQALSLMLVDGMQAYVRGGTYTITTALALPTLGGIHYRSRLIGYTTTRGDAGRPIISVTAAVNGLDVGTGWHVENFEIDGTSTGLVGIQSVSVFVTIHNCRVHHFTSIGITGNDTWTVRHSEVDHCVGGIITGNGGHVFACAVHDNTAYGVSLGTQALAVNCVVSNNTGATTDGIVVLAYGTLVQGNVLYGNGRHGIRGAELYSFTISNVGPLNNVIVNNGGFGIFQNGALLASVIETIDYNAFFNNTSGALSNLTAGPHDVTLTADPFVSAATGDFRLNTTAGGGAACRAVGFPGALPGSAVLGYRDIGVYQHQDTSTTAEIPAGGMTGV